MHQLNGWRRGAIGRAAPVPLCRRSGSLNHTAAFRTEQSPRWCGRSRREATALRPAHYDRPQTRIRVRTRISSLGADRRPEAESRFHDRAGLGGRAHGASVAPPGAAQLRSLPLGVHTPALEICAPPDPGWGHRCRAPAFTKREVFAADAHRDVGVGRVARPGDGEQEVCRPGGRDTSFPMARN